MCTLHAMLDIHISFHATLTFTTCSRARTYFSSVSISSWIMFLKVRTRRDGSKEVQGEGGARKQAGGIPTSSGEAKLGKPHFVAPLEVDTVRGGPLPTSGR